MPAKHRFHKKAGKRHQPLTSRTKTFYRRERGERQEIVKISANSAFSAVKPLPANRDELKLFVNEHFGLDIPDKKVCPHHDSPLDYLTESFLGQRDLLIWANRGGGKTMLAAVATLLDAMFHGPLRICVLGGSFDQSDRLADYIRLLLEKQAAGNRAITMAGRSSRQKVRLADGSEIRILAQSQRAVRGQHVQKIRCDEVDLFDSAIWRAVQFSTKSDKSARGSIEVLSTLHRSGGLMERLIAEADCRARSFAACREGYGTQNLPSEEPACPTIGYKLIRWCLWEVIERCNADRKCEECALADDCLGIARRANGFFRIDDAIAIKLRSSRAAWDAEMLCLGAKRDWLVFNEFNPAVHVREVDYCADFSTYRAMDFGYQNPFVCLWIQLTPDGAVHVVDEYLCARRALHQHADVVQKRYLGPVTMTYVDPAGRAKDSTSGSACTEMLAAAGMPCACRGSTINEGLELIRAALAPAAGPPTLFIHPRCSKLIDAFNNYHYPPPESLADHDKPVKDGPDHLIDALRYFFVNCRRPRIAVNRAKY